MSDACAMAFRWSSCTFSGVLPVHIVVRQWRNKRVKDSVMANWSIQTNIHRSKFWVMFWSQKTQWYILGFLSRVNQDSFESFPDPQKTLTSFSPRVFWRSPSKVCSSTVLFSSSAWSRNTSSEVDWAVFSISRDLRRLASRPCLKICPQNSMWDICWHRSRSTEKTRRIEHASNPYLFLLGQSF